MYANLLTYVFQELLKPQKQQWKPFAFYIDLTDGSRHIKKLRQQFALPLLTPGASPLDEQAFLIPDPHMLSALFFNFTTIRNNTKADASIVPPSFINFGRSSFHSSYSLLLSMYLGKTNITTLLYIVQGVVRRWIQTSYHRILCETLEQTFAMHMLQIQVQCSVAMI